MPDLNHFNADFFSKHAAEYQDSYSSSPGLHKFLAELSTRLPPASRVLDIGCGTGVPVATTLAAANHSIHGLDFADAMAARARANVPSATITVTDYRTWQPDKPSSYDAVLNIFSFFTLRRHEIEIMLPKWVAWTKPGGLLAIATIAADGKDPEGKGAARFDEDGKCAQNVPCHFLGEIQPVTLFTKAAWAEMFQAAGCEVVHELEHWFQPPEGVDTAAEMDYFIIAKKVAA